jgi:hypothetical protein
MARLLGPEMVGDDEGDDGCNNNDGEVLCVLRKPLQQHYDYPQTANSDSTAAAVGRRKTRSPTRTSSSSSKSDEGIMPPTNVVSYTDLFLHNPQFDWFLLSYIVTNLGEYVFVAGFLLRNIHSSFLILSLLATTSPFFSCFRLYNSSTTHTHTQNKTKTNTKPPTRPPSDGSRTWRVCHCYALTVKRR